MQLVVLLVATLLPAKVAALAYPAVAQRAYAVGAREGSLHARSSVPTMKMKGRAGFAKKKQMLVEEALMGNPKHRFMSMNSKSTAVKLLKALPGSGVEGDVIAVKPSFASFLIASGTAKGMAPGLLQRSRKQHRIANESEEERAVRGSKVVERHRANEEEAVRWAAERVAVAAAAAAAAAAAEAAEALEAIEAAAAAAAAEAQGEVVGSLGQDGTPSASE